MENYKNSKIGQETAQKYGDIIEMERPQTEESLRKHPRMTLQNRAKIFSPFAALRGYDEQLAAEKQRTERVTKRILTEEEMSALSDRLMQVTKGMTITVRYFKEDTTHPEVPAVGNYITLTGKADRIDPVFVIGSEVPIPGGATEAEDTLAVTKPEAFRDTVSTYQRVWTEEGVGEGMKDVIAVVVQPGVEFGDEQVFDYNPAAAVDLCAALKEFPDICFEGHSTDYQTATDLYNMVTDGIAILKVGPALTFGLREALFSLSMMEKELVPEEKRANFIETLDQVMLASPANWEKHYHGDEKHLAQCRKYSYSDRARYYIGQPEVVAAMNKLFDNLREYPIPMNMLHQYMPISYAKIREGQLKLDPRELAMDGIVQFMLDYESAV